LRAAGAGTKLRVSTHQFKTDSAKLQTL
jgi:hypothetical protein